MLNSLGVSSTSSIVTPSAISFAERSGAKVNALANRKKASESTIVRVLSLFLIIVNPPFSGWF
jgi:hypothetical protein